MEILHNASTQAKTQVNITQQNAEMKSIPKQEVKPVDETTQTVAQPQVTEVDLRDLIDTLNKALDPFNTSIKFGFDNNNDVFFVSVIDTNTNDTIRRFPVDQAKSLVTKMNEIVGMIFDEKG